MLSLQTLKRAPVMRTNVTGEEHGTNIERRFCRNLATMSLKIWVLTNSLALEMKRMLKVKICCTRRMYYPSSQLQLVDFKQMGVTMATWQHKSFSKHKMLYLLKQNFLPIACVEVLKGPFIYFCFPKAACPRVCTCSKSTDMEILLAAALLILTNVSGFTRSMCLPWWQVEVL